MTQLVGSTATENNASVVLRPHRVSAFLIGHQLSPVLRSNKDRRTFSTHRTFHTSSTAKERARTSIMTLRAHVQVSAFLIGNQLSHD